MLIPSKQLRGTPRPTEGSPIQCPAIFSPLGIFSFSHFFCHLIKLLSLFQKDLTSQTYYLFILGNPLTDRNPPKHTSQITMRPFDVCLGTGHQAPPAFLHTRAPPLSYPPSPLYYYLIPVKLF